MGSMSIVHWLVVVVAMTLLFGGGRVGSSLGELGRGLRLFRCELGDAADAAPPLDVTHRP